MTGCKVYLIDSGLRTVLGTTTVPAVPRKGDAFIVNSQRYFVEDIEWECKPGLTYKTYGTEINVLLR